MAMSMKARVNSGIARSQRSSTNRVPRQVAASASRQGDVISTIGASLATLAMAIALPFSQVQGAAAIQADTVLNQGDKLQADSGTADSNSNGLDAAEGKTEALQKAAGRFAGNVVQTDPIQAVKEGAPAAKTGSKDNTGAMASVATDIKDAVTGLFGGQPSMDIGASIGNAVEQVKSTVSGKVSSDIETAEDKVSSSDVGMAGQQIKNKVSSDIDTVKGGAGNVKDKVATRLSQAKSKGDATDASGTLPPPIAPEIKESLNFFGGKPSMDIGASIGNDVEQVKSTVSDIQSAKDRIGSSDVGIAGQQIKDKVFSDIDTVKGGAGNVKDKVATRLSQAKSEGDATDASGNLPPPIAPEIKESLNLFGDKPSMDIGASIKKAASQVKGKVSGDVSSAKQTADQVKNKVQVNMTGDVAQTRWFDKKLPSALSPDGKNRLGQLYGDKPRMDIGASLKQAAAQVKSNLPGDVDTDAIGAKTDEAKNVVSSIFGKPQQVDASAAVQASADTVKGKVSSDIDTVKRKLDTASLGAKAEEAKTSVMSVFGSGPQDMGNKVKQAGEQVKGNVAVAVSRESAKDSTGKVPPPIAPEIKSSLFGKPKQLGSMNIGDAGSALKAGADKVKGKVSSDVNTVKSKANTNALGSKVEEAKSSVTSLFGQQSVGDKVKQAADNVTSKLPGQNVGDKVKQTADQVKSKVSSDVNTVKSKASVSEITGIFGKPRQIGQSASATASKGAAQVKGKVSSDINTVKGLDTGALGAKANEVKESVLSVFN